MAKKDSQIFDSPRSISTSDALAAPPCGFWKSISFWHCLQLVDSLVFGGCHRILPIVAFTDYFLPRGPENPPAGDYELLQVWLTVPSILLVTAPAVYILVTIIREVFCKQRTADIWFFGHLGKDLYVLLCSLAACHASVHPSEVFAERPAGVHFRCSHSIHARVDSPLGGPGSGRSVSPHLSCHIPGVPSQICEALTSCAKIHWTSRLEFRGSALSFGIGPVDYRASSSPSCSSAVASSPSLSPPS